MESSKSQYKVARYQAIEVVKEEENQRVVDTHLGDTIRERKETQANDSA